MNYVQNVLRGPAECMAEEDGLGGWAFEGKTSPAPQQQQGFHRKNSTGGGGYGAFVAYILLYFALYFSPQIGDYVHENKHSSRTLFTVVPRCWLYVCI